MTTFIVCYSNSLFSLVNTFTLRKSYFNNELRSLPKCNYIKNNLIIRSILIINIFALSIIGTSKM